VKQDGKGFIAGHAATVAYYEWPEFTQMIGAFMESEFRVDTMQIINEDPAFPGAGVFPKTFAYTDQFPVMRMPFTSKDAHVILRLDPSKMTPQQRKTRADDDFPLVWAKSYGKGRVYNLTIGHQEQVWDDPKFREMAHQGIRWALGLVDAKVDPQRRPRRPGQRANKLSSRERPAPKAGRFAARCPVPTCAVSVQRLGPSQLGAQETGGRMPEP